MPKVGEFGRCCADEWDSSQRCDDEEYYVYVESLVQGGEAADHLYMVQDLEENTEAEALSLDRHSFLRCCSQLINDVEHL